MNPLTTVGYIAPTDAAAELPAIELCDNMFKPPFTTASHDSPSDDDTTANTAPNVIIHPLLVPESLEPQDDDSNNTTSAASTTNNAFLFTKKAPAMVYVKQNQPRFFMQDWVSPTSASGDNASSSSSSSARFVTFTAEVAPMFVAPATADPTAPSSSSTPMLAVSSSSAPQQQQQPQLKPLQSLRPLRQDAFRALCSALLCDKPISLKTLSQRLFDGSKALASASTTAAANTVTSNPFKQLMEDLTPSAATTTAAQKDGTSTPTAVSSSASSPAAPLLPFLLQWALFLANPAGHITPIAFLEGREQCVNNSNITLTQVKGKPFELQVRFYSFIDEKLFLACHAPTTAASTAAGAPSASAAAAGSMTSPSSASAASLAGGAAGVVAAIANKCLMALAKENEAAVLGAATSIHGLLPVLVTPKMTSAAGTNASTSSSSSAITPLVAALREAFVTSNGEGGAGAGDDANDDDDGDDDDLGSLVSGHSAGTAMVGRRPMSLKVFRRIYGSRHENLLKYRTITLFAAANFVRVVNLFLKFVSTDLHLNALEKFVKAGCVTLTDGNGGMAAMFSSQNVNGGLGFAASSVDFAWLDAILGRPDLLATLVSAASSGGSKDIATSTTAAVEALKKLAQAAVDDLPALLAADEADAMKQRSAADGDDSFANNKNAASQQKKTYASTQKPIRNYLFATITTALAARRANTDGNPSSTDIFGDSGSTNADGTPSLNGATKSSLDLMLIHSSAKSKSITSPSSSTSDTVGGANNNNAFTAAARIEVLKQRLRELCGGGDDHDISTAAFDAPIMTLIRFLWQQVPRGPIQKILPPTSVTATKRPRESAASSRTDATVPSPLLAADASPKQQIVEEPVVVPKLTTLTDMPMKVKMDWAPFYDNPTAAGSVAAPTTAASSSSAQAPLWARTSQTETHWMTTLIDLISGNGLEYCQFVKLSSGGASEHPISRTDASANNSGAVVKPLTLSAGKKPSATNPHQQLLNDIFARLCGSDEVANQLMCASITTRRTPSKKDPNTTTTASVGILKWVLEHSDAVLRNKFLSSSAESGGRKKADATATEAASAHAALHTDTDAHMASLVTSDIASKPLAELQSHLAARKAQLASLTATTKAMRVFSAAAKLVLERYESLMGDVASFVQDELVKAAAGGEKAVAADQNPSQFLLGIQCLPFKADGSISFADLDSGAVAKLDVDGKKLLDAINNPSSVAISSQLLGEIAAFVVANSKRATRLKGLVCLVDSACGAVSTEIVTLKEEMWLVSP